jgi:hypothetical protein
MKRVGLLINRLNLCCCLIFLSSGFLQAETHIMSSTTLKVMPGTTMTTMDNLLLDNGGVLRNQGTMVIKGNLVNNNTSPDSLGSGTFIFSGTSAQTIIGQNIFKHLTINNSNGVGIQFDNQVTDTLEFTTGLLKLRTYNLTLGAGAKVIGTLSGSAMVAADSTGQLKKIYSSAGSFLFPVGDTTGNYTPVTLNFAAGTFGSTSSAGVNLRKRKYNDPNLVTDYLKRYWTVTTSNITGGVSCNATFKYISPTDVQGTETNVNCIREAPLTNYGATNAGTHTLTANGLNSFGVFTGGHGALNTGLTVYLQGPYNTVTHAMNTALKTANLIPTHHPYNVAPWNYAGDNYNHIIPANAVDWVLVELRQANTVANAQTSLARRAAFLLNNGTVVDTDGVSPVKFYNVTLSQNLFPVIWQRNHMPVIAANAVGINPGGTYQYDYSTASTQVYGGTNGCKLIDTSPSNRYGMLAGDANNDGSVYLPDYTDYWVTQFGTTNSYQLGDFNLDTNVNLPDYTDYWVINFGLTNPLPHP